MEPDFDVRELSSTGRQVEVALGGAVQLQCPAGILSLKIVIFIKIKSFFVHYYHYFANSGLKFNLNVKSHASKIILFLLLLFKSAFPFQV